MFAPVVQGPMSNYTARTYFEGGNHRQSYWVDRHFILQAFELTPLQLEQGLTQFRTYCRGSASAYYRASCASGMRIGKKKIIRGL